MCIQTAVKETFLILTKENKQNLLTKNLFTNWSGITRVEKTFETLLPLQTEVGVEFPNLPLVENLTKAGEQLGCMFILLMT